ncbi:hypothetical protein T492DRAFT_833520 [Pavlovales sp. CCMP2436]|nr:hypothetical protein T492DRAFT_833520 [Pavlovales sp. CCMP2436]
MPHQREGIEFILRCNGRCLIADEMGLGKTVQTVQEMGLGKTVQTVQEMGLGKTVQANYKNKTHAFFNDNNYQAIAALAAYSEDWPALIVAPPTLLANWREELNKWLPEEVLPNAHVIK